MLSLDIILIVTHFIVGLYLENPSSRISILNKILVNIVLILVTVVIVGGVLGIQVFL